MKMLNKINLINKIYEFEDAILDLEIKRGLDKITEDQFIIRSHRLFSWCETMKTLLVVHEPDDLNDLSNSIIKFTP